MSRIDEIKERWRNWGNVLLRVRPLPGQPAVYVGVAEVQVPDVVQFVYGADGDVRVLLDEADGHLSTLESVRFALGKVARFASGPEVPPASDGPGLIGYLNGALSRMVAEVARLAPAAAGHRYAAGMAEAGEAIAGQELEGERAHSAKLRQAIRLVEEALVSDGSKRPVWGEGDELDHVAWDVRTMCRKLDEAKAARDEWARQCNMASEHQADTASAANVAAAEVTRLTKERDDARDDATRFRHELKLAEGCLSKWPHLDVGSVIAGLRLAQKRETGTWAIPAEKHARLEAEVESLSKDLNAWRHAIARAIGMPAGSWTSASEAARCIVGIREQRARAEGELKATLLKWARSLSGLAANHPNPARLLKKAHVLRKRAGEVKP